MLPLLENDDVMLIPNLFMDYDSFSFLLQTRTTSPDIFDIHSVLETSPSWISIFSGWKLRRQREKFEEKRKGLKGRKAQQVLTASPFTHVRHLFTPQNTLHPLHLKQPKPYTRHPLYAHVRKNTYHYDYQHHDRLLTLSLSRRPETDKQTHQHYFPCVFSVF